MVGQNSHCLQWICCCVWLLQSAAPFRLALLSESTTIFFFFFEPMPAPNAFWQSRWHQSLLFYFDVPCGCWPWFCSAIGVTYQDREADRNMQSAQTSARELLLVFGIPPPLGCTQQKKQKNKQSRCSALCMHMYSYAQLICKRQVVMSEMTLLNQQTAPVYLRRWSSSPQTALQKRLRFGSTVHFVSRECGYWAIADVGRRIKITFLR